VTGGNFFLLAWRYSARCLCKNMTWTAYACAISWRLQTSAISRVVANVLAAIPSPSSAGNNAQGRRTLLARKRGARQALMDVVFFCYTRRHLYAAGGATLCTFTINSMAPSTDMARTLPRLRAALRGLRAGALCYCARTQQITHAAPISRTATFWLRLPYTFHATLYTFYFPRARAWFGRF